MIITTHQTRRTLHGAALALAAVLPTGCTMVDIYDDPIVTNQPVDPAPVRLQRGFGGFGPDVGNAVLGVGDDGWIITGYTTDHETDEVDALLVRIAPDGAARWMRLIGGPGDDYGWDLVPMEDGGWVVVGFTTTGRNGSEDVLLVRTDEEGRPRWWRTYGTDGDERAWSLLRSLDGGFTLIAQTRTVDEGEWDILLVQTDVDGNELWSHTYGGPGVDRAFDAVRTDDGGVVLAGVSAAGRGGDVETLVLSVGPDGTERWRRTFGGAGSDIGHAITAAPDGGFLVAGYAPGQPGDPNQVVLMRIDAMGGRIWRREYGGRGDDRGMDLIALSNGGFAVVGSTKPVDSLDWQIVAFRVDDHGEPTGEGLMGSEYSDRGVAILETADGTFVTTGSIGRPHPDGGDLALIQFDLLHPEEINVPE